MGIGVLEPRAKVVQGTILLFDSTGDDEHNNTIVHLKHSKDGKVLLTPQPSDLPDDPLNWPLYRRDFAFALLAITTVLSGVHGPLLSPVTIQLATKYNTTITSISQLSSYMTLAIGIFAYMFSVITRTFGKRGVTVLGCLILVIADSWAAGATSYGSLMGARVLSGIGQAVFEALALTTIPDLYFVHERGTRIAAFIYALQAGVFLGVPIATQIIRISSVKWAFGGLAVAEGVMLVLLFFFFHETAFKREHVDVLAHQGEEDNLATQVQDGKNTVRQISNVSTQSSPDPTEIAEPQSTWSKLSLYQGRFSHSSPITLAFRVLALTLHPIILWAACTGLPASWLVGLSYTINALLAAPPYNMSSTAIGNMYIAGWLGCTAGLVSSLPNDWIVKRIAKRNRNVYEPEFRLVLIAPAITLVVFGLTAWGWGGEVGTSWVGMAFFFAIACAGAVLINSALISYLIDAHRQFAVESQVILFAFKNLMPFGMGYYFVDWWIKDGNKKMWGIMAGISAGLAFIGILVYTFGKKLRAYWMIHPFLGIQGEAH
ncbi:MFS general substrate transporter [Glonium stellatum]|uniref:MFS general substrate transporter n=1 Tax=Glonium stellatum TaxID=574774 RepID=A0A8E2EV68_9PEZI|nr:MFS general substrate transporter [Glonium stellatum]